jgi:hypothetical protein
MGKGVLYKSNGSSWSKSKAMKGNGSRMADTIVKHSNGSTWYDNFPMEQEHTQNFYVQWTHGYKASGQRLDTGVWGDHPRSGDSVNFVGLFGFDRTDMKNFVANGKILEIKFTAKFEHPGHNGEPIVEFFPHVYTSKPTSYSGYNANKNYKSSSQFNERGAYTRTIILPDGAWLNGSMAGIAIQAPSATAANSCRFAGKTSSHSLSWYNSYITIKVLK